MRKQSLGNRWLTLVLWTLLCGVCMTAMLILAANKTIAISDVAGEQTDAHGHGIMPPEKEGLAGTPLKLARGDGQETRLCIPLESGIKAEQVVMENRYMERQLWIYIEGAGREFYLHNALTGNVAPVAEGSFEFHDGEAVLKMQFEEILEFQSVMDGSFLYIDYRKPGDVYPNIAVVDPAWGGGESGAVLAGCAEKDLNLQIALALKEKLDKTDVKVYYTRLEDIDVEPERRAALANDLEADLFIRIGLDWDERDGGAYGVTCLYNGDYFLPDFGSVQLADLVERRVTQALSGRALGLCAAGEDSVLSLLEVPACEIRPGFLSNSRESGLLQTEGYREKIAEGIAQAILDAYKSMESAGTGA